MEAGVNVVVQLATTDGWDPPSGQFTKTIQDMF